MSLLTDTAGTPARVHALLKLLAALEEPTPRPTVELYMRTGAEADSSDQGETAFRQTLGCAKDLRLVDEHAGLLRLADHGCPADHLSFADLVHRRLTSHDVDAGDAVILDAFAYVAFKADTGPVPGPHWFMESRDKAIDELRGFIDRTRGAQRSGTFNESRWAPWQKWTELLGLTVALDRDRPFPEITTRVARTIASDDFPIGRDVPGREFLDLILMKMPYLPGGRRSLDLLGPPARDGVSDLLAAALRDLEADEVLELRSLGDAGNAMILSGDGARPTRSFNSVTRVERGSAT